ncbi:MAG: nickel pincer cofactor biosynthesis protein LarB [Deltaproteobacteria bacterium]|nr:nickel pincer cofactor biosynthesis protein LarB [Deltaproteobacteria bacterium]
MELEDLTTLLEALSDKRVTVDEAVATIRDIPFSDLGYAKIDHHRSIRCGFPEVIFCQNKTTPQILEITCSQIAHHETVLGTRASQEALDAIRKEFPDARVNRIGRCFWHKSRKWSPLKNVYGKIVIVTAGTADLPVAEEARTTCMALGHPVELICDIGVSGIHRLCAHKEALQNAAVIIVIAGMEGALPSVITGLVACPVIGVPTSVGYGSHFNGLVPLFAMLNSCASGMTVVNVDNGFGAAFAAGMINRTKE